MQLFRCAIVAVACLISTGSIQFIDASFRSRRSAKAAVNLKVDTETSDAIALKVLSMALELKNGMYKDNPKTVLFSPMSVMSVLAIIMIGSTETRMANLTAFFGQSDMAKLHQQFGMMLTDVVQSIKENTSPLRQTDPWHKDTKDTSLLTYKMVGNGTQSVRLSNGLFLQLGHRLKLEHRQKITAHYRPDILHVDFRRRPMESKNTINTWINLQTNENIDEMMRMTFDSMTDRVIVTVMSLRAMWEMNFVTGLTKNKNFYRNRQGSKEPISVPMMSVAGALPYYLNKKLDCHIIGIPYEGEMTTMYLIKPLNSSDELLDELHRKLTAEIIEEMIKNMRRRSASAVIPKMSFDIQLALRSPLERMGFGSIFDALQSFKNKKAASRGSLSTKVLDDLTVTQIFQQIHFRVDERGTEINDATIGVEVRSGTDVTFQADEPFIILVRNDITKLALFYGVVYEPLTSS